MSTGGGSADTESSSDKTNKSSSGEITKKIDNGITIIGTEEFVNSTELSINRLKKVDSEFQKMFNDLNANKAGVTIRQTTDGNYIDYDANTVYWNPTKNTGGIVGEKFRHPRVGLAHELGHA
ncbi:MAG: hypothetical protein A2096_07665 [Spirochaetes bacterium GWF1_41_5]|nr:MAG: hypothetical protein A2096_07665 [Spirochaetes bacterium GWF1_41_5]HBE01288.1 hypothetical protein [Spirochaetia bacterium]